MKLANNFRYNQSVFIHIPKAAGNSFSIGLYGIDNGHYTAFDYYKDNKKEWEKLFSFTVVRNPLERFLSAYNFLKNNGVNKFDKQFSIKQNLKNTNVNIFIDKYFNNRNRFSKTYLHFIPQINFILHQKYQHSLISRVYKFESLEDSYKDIVRDIKLVNPRFEPLHDSLPKINETKTKFAEKTSLDEINDKNIKIIKDYYSADYQMFGYL